MAAFVAAGPMATPASADEGDPYYLQINKSISKSELTASEQFTYTIEVTCSEADCINAVVDDPFPTELDGFPITNVSFTPPGVPYEAEWTSDGVTTSTPPATFGENTALHVDLLQPISAGNLGLENGTTFTITVTSQVPANHPPGEVDFTNDASTTADNAHPVNDTVPATILVPQVIGVDVTKSWSPSEASWAPGTASTIGLDVANASNGAVETLVLQEPAAAPNGATALDSTNPFVLHDFAGFDSVSAPDGANAAKVDAYVLQAGAWTWIEGSFSAGELALPSGVDAADVGGLRISWQGTALLVGDAGSAELALTQRELDRNTGQSFEAETRTTANVVEGQAGVEGRDPAVDDATASHTIIPTEVSAAASKNINPARIPAGDTADATIAGTNTSSGNVAELRLSDLDYFTADLTFGGFAAAPVWPTGATEAEFVYYPIAGGDPVSVPFANGETPAVPAGVNISGFELVYTAPNDAIVPNTTTSAAFVIATDPNMAEAAAVGADNTVVVTVETASGRDATASDSDDLTVVAPAIIVDLEKSVLPSSAVRPGENVVTSLTSSTAAASEFINPKTIVVEDSWGDQDDFWNAFNLSSVSSTQVLSNSTLQVAVEVDGEWVVVETFASEPDSRTVSLSEAEILAAIAPAAMDDVTGIQFTFTADTTFAAGTTVNPYFTSQARTDLRDGEGTVTTGPGPEGSVVYTNTATTTGIGVTPNGQELTGTDLDTGQATIITDDGEGPGPGVNIGKSWNQPTVDSQSDQTRTTTLAWRVAPGFDSVAITDPVDPAATDSPEETVFQAFNLRVINPIPASSAPYSNGWYLKYDTITSIELYNGTTSEWDTVPAPSGGWINAGGQFVGHTLTAAQRESTIGVRINLAENTAARQAATQPGAAYDPYAPLAGTGVATSSADRVFQLQWQIRDKVRVGDDFVTADIAYNTDDLSIVNNTASVVGTNQDGTSTDTTNATIRIVDQPPAVLVTKTANPGLLYVPPAGSPADAYPSTQFAITGKNDSTAAASYVRLTDPAPCEDGALADCATSNTADDATANPYTGIEEWADFGEVDNPFNRFDMTSVTIGASIPAQISFDQTTVWLLSYADGEFTSESMTATEVNALTADELADVVAISVAFQGADPATNGGSITTANNLTITIDADLRSTFRGDGEAQLVGPNDAVTTTNRVYAQTYDPVTAEPDVVANANDNADVVLSGGTIDVVPAKSVSPNSLTEPERDTPITVTLGANQGISTLSPVEVWLEDQEQSPDFWNTFNFTGLGTLTAPTGADQAQVDVYGPFGDDGELEWLSGTPQPVAEATVPVAADAYADIQGIRVTYTKADGTLFSNALPAPGWSAAAQFTVQIRDELRDGSGPTPIDEVITNTVTVQSHGALASSDEKSTPAVIDLNEGTHRIAVNKLANNGVHFANPGTPIPWRLQFQNNGTGYLTVTELRDILPAQLVFLSEPAPTYTAQDGGLLSEDVTYTVDGQEIVFTWPDEGNQMAPGEIFEITLYLELQPTTANTQVTNTMVVTTEQNLESCTNIVPNGIVTDDYANDDTTCGTTDYVMPTPGPNLFTLKGVQGSLPGAINPGNPQATCATFEALGESYYRTPCAANSVVNGIDNWVLHVANAGTEPVTSVTLFDQLPTEGDSSLVSGGSRGSQYTPVVVADSLNAALPEGSTYVLEVTESAGVCVGTWATVETAEPCAQNGEVWVEVSENDIDWDAVTGIRVQVDFTGTAAGALQPGEAIDLTFSTQNVLMTDEHTGGVSVDVPGADQFAWNQFGVKYTSTGVDRKIAPARVGTHLLYGPIEVSKDVTGPAADYAASSFDVDVICAVGDVALNLGDQSTVTLSADNGFTHRIDGIPVGASCVLTETGEVGEYGETSRDGTPATLDVELPAGVDDPVPAAQTATIQNIYEFTGLSVSKAVTTEAVAGDFGPFDFELTCVAGSGIPVTFDEAGATTLTFTLEDGATFQAPADRIPVGSDCTVTEVDPAHADSVVITGTNVVDNGDGSAVVTPGTDAAEVAFTNAYHAGVIQIAKLVDGEAGAQYGAGPFGFDVQCTWQGQNVLDEQFELGPDGTQSFGPLPNGTDCVVTETEDGGATSTTLTAGGEVTIEAGADEVTTTTVTATNTFDMTGLSLTKLVSTAVAEDVLVEFGPYEFELICVFEGQDVTFDDAGATAWLLAVEAGETVWAPEGRIPAGSDCTITETDAAYADSITIDGEGVTDNGEGSAKVAAGVETAVVTATNHYNSGLLQVQKVVDGPAGERYGVGPFGFEVQCTWQGQDVFADEFELGPEGSVQFGPLPNGTECVVTEVDDAGATSTELTNGGEVTITAQTAEIETTTVTATNTFEMTGLSVTKLVDTEAVVGDFGPFDFEMTCVSSTGIPVIFDENGQLLVAFTLEGGEVFTAPEGWIPVGAECTISEVGSAHADSIVVIGENVTDQGDGVATVVPGLEPAEVIYTNAYDSGVLQIVKVVDGAGAELYGAGPFTFEVLCTWQDQTVIDEAYQLAADSTRTVGPLPNGTVCQVEETGTGGANASVLEPTGEILITTDPVDDPEPGETGPVGETGSTEPVATAEDDVENGGENENGVPVFTVTATNTFDLTALLVTKSVTGDTASAGAKGTFTVELVCTRPVDGANVAFDVPGGAERTISAGGEVVYASLPVDATCALSETDDGGADSSSLEISGDAVSGVSIDGASGTATLGAADQANADLTNHFEPKPRGMASTGVDVWGLGSLAALLIAAGWAILALAHRRKATA